MFLNKYPFIKDVIRSVRYNIFKPKLTQQIFIDIKIDCVPSEPNEQSFFGYYTNAYSNNYNQFLYHTTESNERVPNTPATVNLYDLEANKRMELGITKAWNWQQGSMLQWLSPAKIIFNDFDQSQNKYISKILDIKDPSDIKYIDKPIYSLDSENMLALSLNFKRLAKYRPEYGYSVHRDKDNLTDDEDGIWMIDLDRNSTRLLFSLYELQNLPLLPCSKDNWVNHIQLSPNSSKFLFLYRNYVNSYNFTSSLVLYDIVTADIDVILASTSISHYDWYDNEKIIIWCEIEGKSSYKLLDIYTKEYKEIAQASLYTDGHPSFSIDRKYLITDTYPDRSRLSSLILMHFETQKAQLIGKFHQPIKYNDVMRCDLHPRWSNNNRFISFDSTHTGKREMHYVDIENFINNG